MTDPVIHPPGIYFGLSDELYHADPALGSSSLKALALNPHEYQFDRLHGEDTDTDAMLFGSALHKRVLESKAAFETAYYPAAKLILPEGCLRTTDDLKKWLEARDVGSLSKMKKSDLIGLIQRMDATVPIEDVIKEEHDAANAGKTMISAKRWAQVQVAAEWMQRDPLLGAVMEDGSFTDGAPEVSIFYEDRSQSHPDLPPVRLKCRFDRLLRHAIVDLKTFAPMFMTGHFEGDAVKAIERMRYDLQAASYLRGWEKAKALFAGTDSNFGIYGEEPFSGFLDQAFEIDRPAWIWVMVKSKGAPEPLVVDWKAKIAREAAAMQIERAIDSYVELRDRYGDDKDWPPARAAFTLDDQTHNPWFGRP